MKNLYLIPILSASLILSSCFGSKDDVPESQDPAVPESSESNEPTSTDEASPVDGATGRAPAELEKPVSEGSPTSEGSSASSAPGQPEADANSVSEPSETADAQADPSDGVNPTVTISTSAGDITLELFAKEAPESVSNFLSYATEGYYDNTVFHRVIKGFMVQGGGFGLQEEGVIKQKETKDPVKNEAKNGLKNSRGTVAMARTSAPHSATSQFFINHADNANLDFPSFDGWGYAVFGKVVKGLDVVDKIAEMPTGTQSLVTKAGPRPMQDVPAEPIVIKSITVSE